MRGLLLAVLLASALPAQEPAYPESAAAQPNADVEVKAIQVQIVHQAEGCEDWKADPPTCRKADHFMYWIGKQNFACAEPQAGVPLYVFRPGRDPDLVTLSDDYVKYIEKEGKANEDKDRPGLCTSDLVIYADARIPCRYVVDVVVASARGGHVWRLYARCASGLLPMFLPIDMGLMPPVAQQGSELNARVGVRLDPATHKPAYQVVDPERHSAEPAADLAELEKLLKKVFDHLHERFPTVSFPLVVSADPDAPYSTLIDVVSLGRKVGYQQVQLAITGPK